MNQLLVDLLTARRVLREGGSLAEAAEASDIERGTLDVILWRYAGRLNDFPGQPRTAAHLARRA